MTTTSVLGALRITKVSSFGSNATRIAGAIESHTCRSFTSTARRNVHITKFTPASSPALDELLNTIRNKIILPSYLPLEQRKKIYSPKYAKQLQSDPITIEIDGEILKFRHLNALKGDLPETRASLLKAVESFETPDDFANLKPLLEGVANTKHKIPHSTWAKLVRIVGTKGHVYDLIECARTSKRTNFKLNAAENVNRILFEIQMKAINSQFAEGETRQALRWAEMVVDLLQTEDHQPPKRDSQSSRPEVLPFHQDPMILIAPLHLAAALAVKHKAGEEIVEKVDRYANDIVRLWPENKKLMDVYSKAEFKDDADRRFMETPSQFVAFNAPLLHGLDMAAQAAKPELAEQLRARHDVLAGEVQKYRKAIKKSPSLGEDVYQKVYG